jgi:Xaa-Pro dipeptidase
MGNLISSLEISMTNPDRKSSLIKRHSRLFNALQDAELKAVVINPGPALTYLTGLHFHLSERPVVALFIPDQTPVIALPELEAGKLDQLPFDIQPYTYGEDPSTWGEVFRRAISSTGLRDSKIGLEPRRLRVLELRLLESAVPDVEFISAEGALASLRMIKDEEEQKNLRKAVEIAQNAMQATIPYIKAGKSERDIAAELTLQLLRHGSNPEMPFSPIVASGPNSANPHATPTDRILSPGDLLIIDWGAAYDGYVSDLTRTFAIGGVEAEFEKIANVVKSANEAGRKIAGPGLSAGDIDRATRKVIQDAGYGPFFIHRTGHGLGMEGHEDPYIYAENSLLLKAGMSFTIEPGIYLPDRGGVRIEDDVIVTEIGAESLSQLDRALFRID